MQEQEVFRIHSITPRLFKNGGIECLDGVDATCISCNTRSALTLSAGVPEGQRHTTLLCGGCGASTVLTFSETLQCWLDQLQRAKLYSQLLPHR